MRPRLPFIALLYTLLLVGGASVIDAPSAHAERPSCPELARTPAPSAATLDPAAASWAAVIWAAVESAHGRLDPAHASPRFAIIERPESLGWYCRSQDTVFVAAPLVEYAWLGRGADGKELLAFVLAHELAHRRFDLSPEPAQLDGSGACRGHAFERELDADARAAFLVALTLDPERRRGLSPWRLARQATVARFLASEHGATTCVEPRNAALARSLDTMEGLGHAHDVALALAFAPTDGAGSPRSLSRALLTRLDTLLNPSGAWARVPELAALLALLHTRHAASLAGASCELDFQRYPALAPFDALGQRAPRAETLAQALVEARAMLVEARRRRLPERGLASIDACLDRLETRPATAPSSTEALPVLDLGPAFGPSLGYGFEPGFEAELEAMALLAEAPCASRPSSFRMIPLGSGLALETHLGDTLTCHELVAPIPARLVELAPREALTGSLARWRAACELIGHGRGDDGSEAYGLRCPSVDLRPDDGWTLFVRDDKVQRILRLRMLGQGP